MNNYTENIRNYLTSIQENENVITYFDLVFLFVTFCAVSTFIMHKMHQAMRTQKVGQVNGRLTSSVKKGKYGNITY